MDSRSDLKRKRASGAGEEKVLVQQREKKKKATAAAAADGAAASPKKEAEGKKTKAASKQQQAQKQTGSWAPSAAGGFRLVPVRMKRGGEGEEETSGGEEQDGHSCRYLYIRQHRAGSQASGGGPDAWDNDDARAHADQEETATTLFVANIGDDADTGALEERLLRLFGRCAPVESVTIKSLRRVPPLAEGQRHPQHQPRPSHQSGRGPWLEVTQSDEAEARPLVFAHVTFSSPDGLRSALRHDWRSTAAEDSTDLSQALGKRGVQKWLQEYDDARPDPQRVLAEVDAFMADFDRRQRMAEREEEAALGKPDADGFVTVRRKGRKKVADGGIPIASTKAGPALAAKAQRQESDKVLLDFYRFQRRENRRKQLADLRLRFEEDKKKIAKLRAQRKFKPF